MKELHRRHTLMMLLRSLWSRLRQICHHMTQQSLRESRIVIWGLPLLIISGDHWSIASLNGIVSFALLLWVVGGGYYIIQHLSILWWNLCCHILIDKFWLVINVYSFSGAYTLRLLRLLLMFVEIMRTTSFHLFWIIIIILFLK